MSIPSISPYSLADAQSTEPTEPTDTPAVLNWQVERDRSALLVHDMQKYFLAAYQQDAEPISTVVANLRELIRQADAAGVPVFYSQQPPAQAAIRRGLLTDRWGSGLQSESQADIIDAIAPQPQHHVLTKWRYSAFARTDLAEALRYAGRDQLLITGVYGHIGCQVSAADAFMRDIQPFVVADAIADFSAAKHAGMLEWVAANCGVVVRTADVAQRLVVPQP
ncbi:isochorismatase family protein [Corynebacterium pseudodiphtheriticum]|uniref:isochorismatase family protein n=1 Tax=Corynebacterium pseudodiphtheriticum TaxID=37637 RepID=UPI00254CBAF2|nr:isochorismatase family protein [Corynebacterium pseudodiphtheriticum]MDK8552121.1 isochorismatase family protein [Corynebacterium pseudodiphtheriticum]